MIKNLLAALMRAIARVAASEAGELLSVRRKAHLLEAERYARHAAAAESHPRQSNAPRAVAASRCTRPLRPRQAH